MWISSPAALHSFTAMCHSLDGEVTCGYKCQMMRFKSHSIMLYMLILPSHVYISMSNNFFSAVWGIFHTFFNCMRDIEMQGMNKEVALAYIIEFGEDICAQQGKLKVWFNPLEVYNGRTQPKQNISCTAVIKSALYRHLSFCKQHARQVLNSICEILPVHRTIHKVV